MDDSRVTMTEIVMPEDTNHHGNIFGGRVLALIDKASAIAAMRHCHAPVVTASIDRVDFLAGALGRSILILEAMLHAAFHTSMEVGSSSTPRTPLSGASPDCRALVTLVAVDGSLPSDGGPHADGAPTRRPPEQRKRPSTASGARTTRRPRGLRSRPALYRLLLPNHLEASSESADPERGAGGSRLRRAQAQPLLVEARDRGGVEAHRGTLGARKPGSAAQRALHLVIDDDRGAIRPLPPHGTGDLQCGRASGASAFG